MKKLHWSLLKRLYRLQPRFGVYSRLKRRWLLDNRNWVDQQIIIRRPYETGQLTRCRELIRQHDLGFFFDVGANFGLYSVLLADEPNLRTVIAFEPLPRNADQFYANLFLNSLDDRIALRRFALSDREAEVELFVDPVSTGVSTIVAGHAMTRPGVYERKVRVDMRVFDEEFPLVGVRALIKIDVEGAETQVLSGMRRFLSNNVVFLQVETTSESRTRVDSLMEDAGYRSFGCLGADCYYTNEPA
ncbi:MAG: FkbM family methyltransferase [Pseudomonadota bacterium]